MTRPPKTILELKSECALMLRSLTEHGALVCDTFTPSESSGTLPSTSAIYVCATCGYTQYVHLAKALVLSDDGTLV
jgi:hypothetical protein